MTEFLGAFTSLVARRSDDVERALGPVSRPRVIFAVLRDHAKLAMATGHASLIAEPLADVEGPLVLAGCLFQISTALGQHASRAAERLSVGGDVGGARPFMLPR